MDSLIGRIISHYRIIEKIGAGGMGIVYKAEDTRLHRTVALKFLPPELTRDAKAKQRFVQEAQAASSLDHANICTIYEVDEIDEERLFIAMAYYRGRTLKERIAEGPLGIGEALGVAIHVARGLSKAHARGIVHRDIKPGNVFLTDDGEVKIVDFGLAKLAGQAKLTTTGKTMGTVSYMSPEQARGEETGPATDLWALGVMIYEMIVGEVPFKGDYDVAAIYAIVNETPAAMGSARDDVPGELEGIVRKALAKKESDRYADANALLADLTALKQQLDFTEFTGTKEWKFKGRRRRWAYALAAAVVIAGTAAAAWQLSSRGTRPAPFLAGRPRQVTSGSVRQDEPALSPDGSSIAYTSDTGGNRDIYIVGVQGGAQSRLTADPAPDYYPAWFPDGTALAFVSERGDGTGIWKTDRLGGGATLLVRDAVDPAISPDGTRIAFARPDSTGEYRICVAPLANTDRVTTLTTSRDGLWSHRQPAWSPDGMTICYSTRVDLWTVPSGGGRARRLTRDGWADSCPAWSSDGKLVYFSSGRGGTTALWRVGRAGGEARRLSLGSGYEHDPTVSADGTRLAYATQTEPNAMYLRDLISGREIRLPHLRDECLAAISPDGSRIVYASDQGSGRLDLCTQALSRGAPSGQLERLTQDTTNASCPMFSPDGKWIAYYQFVGDRRDIYTIPATGGHAIRFTDDPSSDTQPAWSPDGSMLAFASERGGGSRIWVEKVEEGAPVETPRPVTGVEVAALSPVWSPDGSRIAFVGSASGRYEVWEVPVDGSRPARRITSGAEAMIVRWDRASGALVASGTWGEDRVTVRRISLPGGTVTPFDPPVVSGSLTALGVFDMSSDGRLLLYSRESSKGDIWVQDAEDGRF